MRKIIRWSQLSRLLTGTRHSIRHEKYCPVEHRNFVNDLVAAIEGVFEKYGIELK